MKLTLDSKDSGLALRGRVELQASPAGQRHRAQQIGVGGNNPLTARSIGLVAETVGFFGGASLF